MKSGVQLTKTDHKSFLSEIEFQDLFTSDSSSVSFSMSYMLGEVDSYFTVISSSANIYTGEKTISGSSNIYGQECVDEGWISCDFGGGSQQMISGSILNIGSLSEGGFIDSSIDIDIPISASTTGDFWCYLRLENLAERTGYFSRASNTFLGYKYDTQKYGDGCEYK